MATILVELYVSSRLFPPLSAPRLNNPFRKLVFLMLIGSRMQAISILGREVMQPRGLIGLGYDSIDHCGREIAQVRVYPLTCPNH